MILYWNSLLYAWAFNTLQPHLLEVVVTTAGMLTAQFFSFIGFLDRSKLDVCDLWICKIFLQIHIEHLGYFLGHCIFPLWSGCVAANEPSLELQGNLSIH